METALKNNILDSIVVTQAWDLITHAQKITLLTHYKPDADGVSACAALAIMLESQGKQTETIYPTTLEHDIKRQPSTVLINKHTQMPDLIIMCDTANYSRLYYPEVFKNIPSINLDHHISNSIKATVNIVTDQISSTCELVYLLMKAWNPQSITPYIAECLLFGILYDTQVFYTQSTHTSTLRVAADLIDLGADLFQLQVELVCNKKPEIIKLWGKFLSDVVIGPKGNAAWSSIKQKDLKALGADLTAFVGFSNFLAQLSDVDITVVFTETEDGKTKVSLRSKKADVNKVAGHFGGGGHKNAAGILSDKPIDQLINELTKLL